MRTLTIVIFAASLAAPAQEPRWVVLDPSTATSTGDATLAVAPDGAILATGKSPASATYVIKGTTKLRSVTGIRLEALPHESLAMGGPGRAKNGNFVLTDVSVASSSRLSKARTRPVRLVKALASWSQVNWPVRGAVDASPKTGWAIHPRAGKAATAVFLPETPIKWKAGVHLAISLNFAFGTQHTLGRFRIAVTDDPNPGRGLHEGGEPWAKTQGKINVAIDRGIEWLMAKQALDGSFPEHHLGYPTGATALGMYTLIKSGVDRKHLAVRKAARFLRCHPPKKTYAIACQILAFTALGDSEDDKRVRRLVALLLDTQDGSGGWAYPHGAPDLSNTQYAALALHMAAKKGVKIPRRVWLQLATKVQRHERPDGKGGYAAVGFSYRPKGKATGSMTSAGVGTLAICDLNLRPRRNEITVAVKKGVQWLGRHFSPSSNIYASDNRWVYYYLYGLERAGGLTGERMFGPHDWYREGARWLISKQSKAGSWVYGSESATHTCFALLFLSKATGSVTGGQASGARVFGYEDATKAVSLRASGDRPLAMWVVRFGDKALKDNSWPGEVGKGLHVEKVEYHGSRHKDMKGAEVLQRIGRDPSKPHDRDALAAQHEFPHPGAWYVQAHVTIVKPGTPGAKVTLKSDPVKVVVWDVAGREYLDYGDDSTRNLLRGATATASSEYDKNWVAPLAVDGMQLRAWLTKDNQPNATIKFRLRNARRANTLLLSHTITSSARLSRVAKAEVKVNGAYLGTVTMIRSDRRKTVFTFPKTKTVRTLELKIVETHAQGRKGVGFAEVELQLRDDKKSR